MTKAIRRFMAGMILPLALSAFAPLARGQIFVSLPGHHTIQQFTENGGPPTTFATGLSIPNGLAFDNAGLLYAANSGEHTIVKFPAVPTLGGSQAGLVFVPAVGNGLFNPRGLIFDAGSFFVANGGLDTIERFDHSGVRVLPTFAAAGLSAPDALAIDGDGNVYAANAAANTIAMFPPAPGAPSIFASGLSGLRGLAWRGGVLYAASNGGGNTILEFATGSSTGAVLPPAFIGVSEQRGLAFDSSGSLYVTSAGPGTLTKFDSSGAILWSASTGSGTTPAFIAIQPNLEPEIEVTGLGNGILNGDLAPSAPGLRTATISIASDDGAANPYDFAISGNGITPQIEVGGGNPLTPILWDGAWLPIDTASAPVGAYLQATLSTECFPQPCSTVFASMRTVKELTVSSYGATIRLWARRPFGMSFIARDHWRGSLKGSR